MYSIQLDSIPLDWMRSDEMGEDEMRLDGVGWEGVGSPVDIDFLRVRDVQYHFWGHVSEGTSVAGHLVGLVSPSSFANHPTQSEIEEFEGIAAVQRETYHDIMVRG